MDYVSHSPLLLNKNKSSVIIKTRKMHSSDCLNNSAKMRSGALNRNAMLIIKIFNARYK